MYRYRNYSRNAQSSSRKETDSDLSRKNAQKVLEQAKFLWDDQAKFADELREKRRTYTVSLILLAGLGVFKSTGSLSPSNDPTDLPVWFEFTTATAATFAILAFLLGAYWLFSERSSLRIWGTAKFRNSKARRILRRFFILYTGLTPDQFHRRDARSRPVQSKSRKSATAELSSVEIAEILAAPPEEVDIFLSYKTRFAYESLSRANNRVNRRIEGSLVFMGIGYGLIAAIFLSYFWYTNVFGRVDSDTNGNRQQESECQQCECTGTVCPFATDRKACCGSR